MKKQILLALLLVFCLSLPVSAAPTVDIQKGNFVLDYSQYDLDLDITDSSYGSTYSGEGFKQSNFSVAYGLTPTLALSIGSQKLDTFVIGRVNGSYLEVDQFDLKATDVKLQKKVNDNMAYYVGMKSMTVDENYTAVYMPTTTVTNHFEASTDNNKFQVGLIYNRDLGEKVKLHGLLGLGSGLTELELGMGYKLGRNVTLDVGYKNVSYDLDYDAGTTTYESEVSGSGVGFGVTAKF